MRVREVKNTSYGILMSVSLKHLSERDENSILLNTVYSEFISFRWFCSTFAIKSTKTKPGIGIV